MAKAKKTGFMVGREQLVKSVKAELQAEIRRASQASMDATSSEGSKEVWSPRFVWEFHNGYHFEGPCSYDAAFPVPREEDLRKWNTLALENCLAAVADGNIKAKVITDGHGTKPHRVAQINVGASGQVDNVPTTSNDDKQHQTPARKNLHNSVSDQMRKIMKPRLVNEITKVIGRPITKRKGFPLDPRIDDPQPPNLYKWRFSARYPSFPEGPIAKWPVATSLACCDALNRGYVSVIALPHTAISQTDLVQNAGESIDGRTSPDAQKRHEKQYLPGVQSSADNSRDLGEQQSHGVVGMDMNSVMDDSQGYFDHDGWQRDLNFEDDTSEKRMKAALCGTIDAMGPSITDDDVANCCSLDKVDQFILLISDEMCESESTKDYQRIFKIKLLIECVRRIVTKHVGWLADIEENLLMSTLSARMESAKQIEKRRQESGILRERIKELEAVESHHSEVASVELQEAHQKTRDLQELLDVQLPTHLAQLKRAREEAREEGYRQALAKHSSTGANLGQASDKDISTASLQEELKVLKVVHALELNKAKEQGKKEGRESATKDEDALNTLLEGHNVNFGRKAREIRTIYRNWRNIPQNLLPDKMLTEGKIPGDKFLIQLARLSRLEKDPVRAIDLLQAEIERRNSQQQGTPTLTNADLTGVIRILDRQSQSESPATSSAADRRLQSPVHSRPTSHPTLEPTSYLSDRNSAISPVTNGEVVDSATDLRRNSNPAPQASRLKSILRADSSVPSRRTSMPNQHIQWDLDSTVSDSTSANVFVPRGNLHRLQESSSIDSTTDIPNLVMMGAGVGGVADPPIQELDNSLINGYIMSLTSPSQIDIPGSFHDFRLELIREFIGGTDGTFTKSGQTARMKQIVDWPEHIRVNLETHDLGPTKGKNGALTFLDGRSNCGELGKVYPTLLKTKPGFLSYIGHYKVMQRVVVPPEIWATWNRGNREAMAEDIDQSGWGTAVMTSRGLQTNFADRQDKRIEDILAFFAKKDEPNLRMQWTLLQFNHFDHKDYKTLCNHLLKETVPEGHPSIDDRQKTESASTSLPGANGVRKDNDPLVKLKDIGFSSSINRHKAEPAVPVYTSISPALSPALKRRREEDIYNATPPPPRSKTLGNVAPMVPNMLYHGEHQSSTKRQKFMETFDDVEGSGEGDNEELVVQDGKIHQRARYNY